MTAHLKRVCVDAQLQSKELQYFQSVISEAPYTSFKHPNSVKYNFVCVASKCLHIVCFFWPFCFCVFMTVSLRVNRRQKAGFNIQLLFCQSHLNFTRST